MGARFRGWPAYGAALWSLIFAFFHIVWAAGWYVGLEPEAARRAFSRPAFHAYDVVVAIMCLIAIPVSLALVMPWGRRVPRRALSFFAWTGTLLLVARAGASLAQVTYHLASGRGVRLGLWEPWFYLGATLFVWSVIPWSRGAGRSVDAREPS